ncbi:hypothetical protein MTO96_033030 [Rhipicephalus appendiculatus]
MSMTGTGVHRQVCYVAVLLIAIWTIYSAEKAQCAEVERNGLARELGDARRIIVHLTRTSAGSTRSLIEFIPAAQPWPPQAPRPGDMR